MEVNDYDTINRSESPGISAGAVQAGWGAFAEIYNKRALARDF